MTSILFEIQLSGILQILLALPLLYFLISYVYLAWWHGKVFLWNTLIHENGRLTVAGSLFYYDHFVACVPMVTVFALSTAGGAVLTNRVPASIGAAYAGFLAGGLLLIAFLLVVTASFLSVRAVGWQRTLDYALQRIERDGVMSKGGNWNQLQLSNIPIALGAMGLVSVFVASRGGLDAKGDDELILVGIACLGVAAALAGGLTALNWCGWQSFCTPRWLAHSIREIATYPLTGIPIALSSVLVVEGWISGIHTWTVAPRWPFLLLVGTSVVILALQLMLLRNIDVLAIAQKPTFAGAGFSVPYLLCSHVFEHFLDFVLIAPLTGGVYALLRCLG